MPLQIIDTTTVNTPIGDPAKTAFEKINANDAYLEGLAAGAQTTANGALSRAAGGTVTGNAAFTGGVQAQGNVVVSPGTLRVSPAANADQLFMRLEGSTGVTIDSVNNSNSAYAAVSLRGSAINLNGPAFASGGLTVPQDFKSNTTNVVVATGTTGGSVYLRPNGAGSVTGQAVLNSVGTLSVVSVNQTSSFDVKTHLEGYTGDAEAELDRLVIVTHQYRKDFLDDGGLSHISFVAENVQDVFPLATAGGTTETVQEPYDVEVKRKYLIPSEADPEVMEEVEITAVETQWREVEVKIPLSIQPVPLLAIVTRAHQQRGRRLVALELRLSAVQADLTDLQQQREDEVEALAQRLQALEAIVETLQANSQPPGGQTQ